MRAFFDDDLIERVYEVEEHAFDAGRLRSTVRERLQSAQVEVQLETRALRAVRSGVQTDRGLVRAGWIFNCTYSSLNRLLEASGVPCVPLRQELAEVALIEPPPALRGAAVTVMCGPFFSMLPFPPARLFSLTHVRYTPHFSWEEREAPAPAPEPGRAGSRAAHMLKERHELILCPRPHLRRPGRTRARRIRELSHVPAQSIPSDAIG